MCGHNHRVLTRSRRRRRLAPLALAPWLVLSPALAPAHYHEADGDHSRAVVHRHFQPHDHATAEISHDAGRVIWLDDVGIAPATFAFPLLQAVLIAHAEILPEPAGWVAISTDDAAPPHGPPRLFSLLRAPPSVSA